MSPYEPLGHRPPNVWGLYPAGTALQNSILTLTSETRYGAIAAVPNVYPASVIDGCRSRLFDSR